VAGSMELRRLQTVIFITDQKEIEAYNKLYQATNMVKSTTRYREEVNQLEEQLREVEDNIRKAAHYKQFVDSAMRSHLHDFTKLMRSLIDGSSESSSVGLEISRFRIKETFEDMKLQMNRFTAGFEANEDLISCINTMEYLMNTAINVYDQIQMGNDQINLGNLITSINTNGLTFNTNDTSLALALEKLEYTLVANTMQNQYTRAVNSFKQLVFPFAPIFLEDIQIPEKGVSENDNLKLMTTKLRSLITKVNSLEAAIIQG
jgi:hypothetical protein